MWRKDFKYFEQKLALIDDQKGETYLQYQEDLRFVGQHLSALMTLEREAD